LSENPMISQKKKWAVLVIENAWLEMMYKPTSNYVRNVLKQRFETHKNERLNR